MGFGGAALDKEIEATTLNCSPVGTLEKRFSRKGTFARVFLPERIIEWGGGISTMDPALGVDQFVQF